MTDTAIEILRVMREDCGFEGWISFGTLLGAARNGHAIGHDSDIDLCFLSTASTPAGMASDLWRIARALRRAGMRVTHASASFVTVRFRGPDGGAAGIDVYLTFFLDGLFYETATVRAPVPREALLPLRDIEFEGRMLPAPADPAALLEVSYGPNWRVPDPSFQHQPGPEIVDRFHGWFGSLMPGRRDWRHANAAAATTGAPASSFAEWVCDHLTADSFVAEVGPGGGADLARYAATARRVVGLDYALPGPLVGAVKKERGASVDTLNLYDRRDVLVAGCLARPATRTARPHGAPAARDPRARGARGVLAARRAWRCAAAAAPTSGAWRAIAPPRPSGRSSTAPVGSSRSRRPASSSRCWPPGGGSSSGPASRRPTGLAAAVRPPSGEWSSSGPNAGPPAPGR